MSDTIEYTGELTVVKCWCGMRHAIPAELRREQLRHRDNNLAAISVYCPLGHSHAPTSGDSALDRERRRADELVRMVDARSRDLRTERASHAATKGQLTKVRNRAARGVCPVDGCHRSIEPGRMAAHVTTKHPDYQGVIAT